MARGQHLTHRCRCGKIIHWPKDAEIGDVWVCRTCGGKTILSTEGQIGQFMDSTRKGVDNNPDYNSGEASSSYSTDSVPSGGTGCMIIILLGIAMFFLAGVAVAVLIK